MNRFRAYITMSSPAWSPITLAPCSFQSPVRTDHLFLSGLGTRFLKFVHIRKLSYQENCNFFRRSRVYVGREHHCFQMSVLQSSVETISALISFNTECGLGIQLLSFQNMTAIPSGITSSTQKPGPAEDLLQTSAIQEITKTSTCLQDTSLLALKSKGINTSFQIFM